MLEIDVATLLGNSSFSLWQFRESGLSVFLPPKTSDMSGTKHIDSRLHFVDS